MYTPSFPYKGNQILLSSDRVHILSKSDSIILTSTEAIALSALGEVHIDSIGKTIVNSPKIEFGIGATEQLILGTSFIQSLESYLSDMETAASLLKSVSESDVAGSMMSISVAGKTIEKATKNLSDKLNNLLSNTTYTV
jgi:hypothetical protein